MTAEEFGKFIKELRTKRQLTTRQLELKSGVSNSYISQIENGKRGIPKPAILSKLAPALKIPYDELMNYAGYMNNSQFDYYNVNDAKLLLPRVMETYETMELNEKEIKAYEYLKGMPQNEVEQDLQRIINKLKSLPAEQRKALELIIDSLFPSSK